MNKQDYLKLQENLHKHHIQCIDNECTADPIYHVKKRVIDWGYEEDYADHHQLYCSCDQRGYYSIQEFMDDYDDEEWSYLFGDSDYKEKQDFLLCHNDLHDVLNTLEQIVPYDGWQYIHGNERWQTVEMFLTKQAADRYIDSKGIRGENCLLYVDSLCRSYEFKELLQAIAKGKLEWREIDE